MKKLIVATLFACFLFSGMPAMAMPGGGYHGTGSGYADNWVGMNLDQFQSEQMQTFRADFLTDVTPLQNQMITLRGELSILWNTDSPDRKKIIAKEKEISTIQAKISEKFTDYRLKCAEILTPEQLAETNFSGRGMGQGHRQRGHHN